MAAVSFFEVNAQSFKNETGQDFCLIFPVFKEAIDKEISDNYGSTTADLIGESFQMINGCFVLTEQQKQIILNHVNNYVSEEGE